MSTKYFQPGFIALMLLFGCQNGDNPASNDTDVSAQGEGIVRLEGEKFDAKKVFTGVPMATAFSDDTVPIPEAKPDSSLPLMKEAYTTGWIRLPGSTKLDVAVGYFFYHLDNNWQIRIWNATANRWDFVSMPSSGVKRLAVSKKNNSNGASRTNEYMVAIGSDGGVYQYNPNANSWTYMSGSGNGIDVAVTSTGVIYYIGAADRVFMWHQEYWHQMPSSGYRITATGFNDFFVRSTGHKMWRVYWDPNVYDGPYLGKWMSTYLNAWDVKDVCGENQNWANYNSTSSILMHVGLAYSYWYSVNYPPYKQWSRVGADYGVGNLACTGSSSPDFTTRLFETINGALYYKDVDFNVNNGNP